MNIFLLAGAIVSLVAGDLAPVEHETVEAKNSCYVNAAIYKSALEAKQRLTGANFFARIVYMDRTEIVGHAVVLFYFDGQWRIYDANQGTFSFGEGLPTDPVDPLAVARKVNPKYTSAHYMK